MRQPWAVHFLHYNFVRVHGSLGTTPAVAAGVSRYKWDVSEIAALLDDPQYADALKVQMRPRLERDYGAIGGRRLLPLAEPTKQEGTA